ncbi:hypothetical protein BKA61DRAFT_574493 [Leptodontidium sp. MPI-SDFR-AT-0119]|nr:hypothetical protein BKA61DRAFT_574493 [Leptodontidium sp. MPI-SDFR-AT-0119]
MAAKASVETESIVGEADSEVESSFNWLSREARGSAYILHMSAKSEQSGVLFAQGNFDSTLYSSLARAQRTYGGQSTFGLEIPVSPEPFNLLKKTGSALRLGEMIERSSFNHRWPFNEYALISNFGLSEDDESEIDIESQSVRDGGSIGSVQHRPWISEREVGTCAVLSFIKDGIMYQMLRLEASTRWEADEHSIFPFFGNVVFEIGGPMKFREFEGSLPMHTTGQRGKVAVPCVQEGEHAPGTLPHRTWDTGGVSLLDCWNNPSIELDIRVHRLGLDDESPSELALYHSSDKGIGYFETEADLGYDKWKKRKVGSGTTVTFMESFRLREGTEPSVWPTIPTSEEIYKHIGISSSEPTAVAAMWETIFARERSIGRISELSEDRLVARCLEKVLHVDLVPASFVKDGQRQYSAIELEPYLFPESIGEQTEKHPVGTCEQPFLAAECRFEGVIVSTLESKVKPTLIICSWKVRFLVKAYEFLLDFVVRPPDAGKEQSQGNKPLSRVTTEIHDLREDPDYHLISKDFACMKYAASYQSMIIRNRIELVVEYLFQSLLQPNIDTPLLPDNILAFKPN